MDHAKDTSVARRLAILVALIAAFGSGTPRADEAVPVLANRDDDDRDGLPDAEDEEVNGEADARDLAVLQVALAPGTTAVRLDAGDAPLRFFARAGEAWQHVGLGRGELLIDDSPVTGPLEVYVEACGWAGQPANWSGAAVVRVSCVGSQDAVEEQEFAVRVAPVRVLPATATVDEVYVATGRYDNAVFLERLRGLLQGLQVPLRDHATGDWREMWMQDTMEIGIAATDRATMSVVLAGLRGADTFPPTLLGPDVAVAVVAKPRALSGGDAWADWYGNLEASPATQPHPQGRVIHGRNRLTGCSFHPAVVAFLTAQGAQPSVWIDTSWLLIKHVDEVVAFLPGADGRGVIVVPDPQAGLALLADTHGDGGGDEAVARRRREAAPRIHREIEAMLFGGTADARAGESAGAAAAGLLGVLGIDRDRVIRLPVAFDVPDQGLLADGGVTDASSLWSNPVNALFVNGTVICGAAGMPAACRKICRERFLAAGATAVEFIDDGCYQKNHGNVHCATNTRRRDAASEAIGSRP
ncbi:MAG: protein-arginine deiminase family protein [Pirellulales bacterium]